MWTKQSWCLFSNEFKKMKCHHCVTHIFHIPLIFRTKIQDLKNFSLYFSVFGNSSARTEQVFQIHDHWNECQFYIYIEQSPFAINFQRRVKFRSGWNKSVFETIKISHSILPEVTELLLSIKIEEKSFCPCISFN